MPEKRMPLTAIKSTVYPGRVFDVTNHFIKREDHPGFGTTRRSVTRVTGSRIYMSLVATDVGKPGKEREIDWPPASRCDMDPDGTIRLYGGGCNQKPDELFLTLVPVMDTAK